MYNISSEYLDACVLSNTERNIVNLIIKEETDKNLKLLKDYNILIKSDDNHTQSIIDRLFNSYAYPADILYSFIDCFESDSQDQSVHNKILLNECFNQVLDDMAKVVPDFFQIPYIAGKNILSVFGVDLSARLKNDKNFLINYSFNQYRELCIIAV